MKLPVQVFSFRDKYRYLSRCLWEHTIVTFQDKENGETWKERDHKRRRGKEREREGRVEGERVRGMEND